MAYVMCPVILMPGARRSELIFYIGLGISNDYIRIQPDLP